MDSESKNFYSLVPNYAAVKEQFDVLYHKPTEKETRQFLNFWQEAYDLWKLKYSPFDLKYVEEKIKVRKSLIEKFGFRP